MATKKVNPTLKKIVSTAKKIYKDNPNKKWVNCIKQASKIVKKSK